LARFETEPVTLVS